MRREDPDVAHLPGHCQCGVCVWGGGGAVGGGISNRSPAPPPPAWLSRGCSVQQQRWVASKSLSAEMVWKAPSGVPGSGPGASPGRAGGKGEVRVEGETRPTWRLAPAPRVRPQRQAWEPSLQSSRAKGTSVDSGCARMWSALYETGGNCSAKN